MFKCIHSSNWSGCKADASAEERLRTVVGDLRCKYESENETALLQISSEKDMTTIAERERGKGRKKREGGKRRPNTRSDTKMSEHTCIRVSASFGPWGVVVKAQRRGVLVPSGVYRPW